MKDYVHISSTAHKFLHKMIKNGNKKNKQNYTIAICNLERKAHILSPFSVNGPNNLSHKLNVCAGRVKYPNESE